MRYLLALVLSLFLSTSTIAQEADHDFSVFRQVKDAVQTVLVHVAKKYGGETYDLGKLNAVVAETNKILTTVKKEYPNVDFTVIGDQAINAPDAMQKGFMFVTTVIKYQDQKGTIQWEFNTVFGINELNFYSVQLDGKPKTFDDYNRWQHMKKTIHEDKENKTEQGL